MSIGDSVCMWFRASPLLLCGAASKTLAPTWGMLSSCVGQLLGGAAPGWSKNSCSWVGLRRGTDYNRLGVQFASG